MTSLPWPAVDVIVPVYNEAGTIRAKLCNLARLDYPHDRIRIIVVDGRSTDGTAEVAEQWRRDPEFIVDVLRSDAVGKPAQLLAGLASVQSEWVLVTDADALLPESVLTSMVALARSSERVGLVGVPVRPAGDAVLDLAHWSLGNTLRRIERRFGSAGLVVGPCYLAHRDLLATMDSHTVVDDVYVSCRALLGGRRIEFAPETALEIRVPVGIRELGRHKLSKAMGYVRESARALRHAGLRCNATSAIFLWRAALLAGLPLSLVGSIAGAVGQFGAGAASAGLLVLAASVAALGLIRGGGWLTRAVALVLTPVLAAAVLTVAFLLLPFVRLNPRYRKVSVPGLSLFSTDAP